VLWVSSSVAFGHGLLDGDGALHGVHDAWELRKNAVARRVNEAAAVLFDHWEYHGLMLLEIANSAGFMRAHEGAVASGGLPAAFIVGLVLRVGDGWSSAILRNR